jgi:protein required for attachment to host cells
LHRLDEDVGAQVSAEIDKDLAGAPLPAVEREIANVLAV